ncbi:unnamed protein product, partial [Didymodactylos carnosus]
SLLSFRISVAEDLLKSNPQPLSSQKRGRPSLHSIDKENLAPIPPRTAPGPAPSTNSRFDKKMNSTPFLPLVAGCCQMATSIITSEDF